MRCVVRARHSPCINAYISPSPLCLLRWVLPCFLLALGGCSHSALEVFNGYAEGEAVLIAAPLSGTLTQVHVKRGDTVAAQAPAFVLEQDSEQAARSEAQARLQNARAQVADLEKGRRPPELDAVRAQLAQAQAALRLSTRTLDRQHELVVQQFVSAASLDQFQTAVTQDSARVQELNDQVKIATLASRNDQIAAARALVTAAQAVVDQAQWRVRQKTQAIPSAGVVLDVMYREGETVAAMAPVVSLLPPGNIKARFFVPEVALGRIHLGDPVSLSCDGCTSPIAARLSFISPQAEYTAPIIYSRESRAALVFMVEAQPAPADALRLHPGQPLEVRLGASAQ